MASHSRNIHADFKSKIIGEDGDSSVCDILTDIKVKIEHDIKVEPGTLNDCQAAYLKVDTFCGNSTAKCHSLKEIGIKTEESIKDEPGDFTSDSKSFLPVTVKTEYVNEFSECDDNYTKEEQYVTSDESIRGNGNMEKHLTEGGGASLSSSNEPKFEEVHLGEMKMEKDEINIESSEMEDNESGEQNSTNKMSENNSHNIHHCKRCRYFTHSSGRFTRHMRTHGEKFGKTFDCVKCEKEFKNKKSLDSHIVTFHYNNGEMMNSITYKIHGCERCRYITVHASNLAKHMGTHEEKLGRTFNCIKCKTEFEDKKSLDSHILHHHHNNSEMMKRVSHQMYPCKLCGYITIRKTNLKIHMRSHGEKLEKNDCIKCGKEFVNKLSLDNHVVVYHSDNSEMMSSVTYEILRCKQCSYITASASHLTRHMRTHGEKFGKTFYCIECEKEFSNKQSLDGHVAVHHRNNSELMKTVTYQILHCKKCNYTTASASHLTKHMRTHGEKSGTFDCIKCKKEFSSKHNLDGHIVLYHRNNSEMVKSITHKIYNCSHCSYITVHSSNLTKHMRQHKKNSNSP